MDALIRSEIFLLMLVLGVFLFGVFLYKKTKITLLQPLLTSMLLLIPFLKWTNIDYDTFYQQTRILNFMLGPSVVALGFVLYEQIGHIKGNVLSILTAVFVGSFVGIVSVVLIAKWLGADALLMSSLAPKSVTTPIAISLAEKSGGVPALTATFVVICGIFGGMVGPVVLRRFGFKSSIAKGLAMGAASHAMGTARALEMGALEGAISGLAIGIMGIMTAFMIPVVEWLF
ncbi:MAG: LrgB family protein [Bacteroidales bacterium]|jgi:predicted murein hydrolase (TIGR00659 family)|nr:LrgB family protein [Bacteroidales bacterium]MDD4770113.1 LrgB family protein [Bacteroidales bacterium]HKL92495.1 LrgB family protein [Bacteroidales bacterium]